jgi:hypothetical protein
MNARVMGLSIQVHTRQRDVRVSGSGTNTAQRYLQ